MPKATIATKSGAVVTIEGTQEEVASLVERLEVNGEPETSSVAKKSGRSTPMGLLSELIARGFFGKPKELGAVRVALEESGHFYPATTLSPLMLRLVRRRELRRIKEKNRWLYAR